MFRARVAALASATVAGACGAFLADNDESAPSPDAGSDAAVTETGSAEGGATIDGPSDAGANDAACTELAPTFSEDFDDGAPKEWQVGDGCQDGGLTFEQSDGGLAAVLSCTGGAMDSYQVLAMTDSYALQRELRVDFSFRIDASAPAHTFGQLLDFFAASGQNLAFFYDDNVVSLARIGEVDPYASWAAKAGGWHAISVTFRPGPNADAMLGHAVLDGVPKDFTVTVAPQYAGPFRLQLGVFFNVGGGSAANAYDAVRLWPCP